MALQQKRALWGLFIGIIWAIAIVVVFMTKGGVTAFSEDVGMRLLVDGIFIGGLLAYLLMMFLTRQRQGQVAMDERDRLIASRATVIQLWSIVFSLVIWAIALGEIYWDVGQIPVIFPYFIAMSSVVVNILAQSAGILIGYWRMERNG